MFRIAVVLLMISFVLEPKLVVGSVSISVKPDTIKAPPPAVGDAFTDSIYVSGITTAQSLAGWQCSLAYNKEVLRFDHFTEGPFLKSAGNTIFVQSLEDTVIGIICSGACLLPIPDVGAVGSGTICYVTWRVKKSGDSPIHIPRAGEYYMETYLLDPDLNEIPISDTVDGFFDDTTYTPPGVDDAFISQVDKLTLQIYPNPFSKNTVIRYSLNVKRDGSYPINLACHSEAAGRDLRLTIHDLAGRLVKSFPLLDSRYSILNSVTWDGSDDSGKRLPSGIYFCKLQVGDESLTKRLLLLR